jgi:hypothetical protein
LLKLLAVGVILASTADHWTTYLCLRSPVTGFDVTEGNPLAAWLFGQVGLVPGLLLDSVITLFAVLVVVNTKLVPRGLKVGFFGAVCVWTGLAVANNLTILHALGLASFTAAAG